MATEQANYVGVYDALCDDAGCLETTPDGVPMQFDYGHLTLEGSELLIGRVRDQLSWAAESRRRARGWTGAAAAVMRAAPEEWQSGRSHRS